MRVLPLLTMILLATSVSADLPADGWPQTRRDAALTGRSNEPALPSARLRWQVLTGAEISGEPVVNGCSVVVTTSDGVVQAFNARSGAALWSYDRAWSVEPEGVSSALAVDGDELHVGLPADPLLERALRALSIMWIGITSYSIDHNEYPQMDDLAAALTPTYIRSLPPNPATGSLMAHSDVPSVGDYRYSWPNQSTYHLGIWGADGGLLDFGNGCVAGGTFGGLDPSWPVSAEKGGTATTLDLAGGGRLRHDISAGISRTLVPTVAVPGTAWAGQEVMFGPLAGTWGGWWWNGSGGWLDSTWTGGAVVSRDAAGASTWSSLAWGGTRGAAAHDVNGNAYVARGAAQLRSVSMATVRSIATACESFAIDNNAYPPSGDLADDLVPIYAPCMPPSFLHAGIMVEGPAASGADYQYVVSTDGFSYELTLWDEDGGILTSIDTGSFVVEGSDRPPQVASIAPDGALRWRTRVGLESQDLTPVALAPDGTVVVGTTGGELYWLDAATGTETGRVDVGEPLALAPAILPDGGVVVITGNGTVVAHAPDRSERWRRWMGATITAAPATTADGLTYVADLDGVLTALNPGDGSIAWRSYLGGAYRAGLTTTPVQSAGWIYVGRSDGALLAIVPRETAGRPETPLPLLATGEKSSTTAGWTWEGVASVPDPGAHWHLRRWRSLLDDPTELLPSHPSQVQRMLDTDAAGPLLFYSLVAVDCGENASF